MHQLGAAEVKLLYTLQWIFLQAADECDDEYEAECTTKKQKQQYLFSVPTLTVLTRRIHVNQKKCFNFNDFSYSSTYSPQSLTI